MNLIFLGAPGVGKGTYADMVAKEYGILHISTGDLLRDEIKKGTADGKIIQGYIDKGNLAPVELVMKVMKKRLSEPDCKKGFILDGFPRSVDQAQIIEKEHVHIDKVIDFTAPEKTIIDRISGRRTCMKCGAIFHIKNIPPKKEGICDKCGGELYQREDQKEDVVKHRLEVYKKESMPVADYYKKKGMLLVIDGNRTPELVFNDLKPILDKLRK